MEEQGKKLTKWLNKLQQESWQLELVVSGFAIFLAIGALDALSAINFVRKTNSAGLEELGGALNFGYIILTSACFFILVNLVLHVLLRGLWISTLGLRYVSGGIDFERLRMAPRFENFLRKRIGSFDNYILRLENLCSVVFAFTFLLIFMLVGIALFFFLLLGVVYVLKNGTKEFMPEETAKSVAMFLVTTLFVTSLLYFIDFVTLGWLKRIRWFSKIYYPIYRFYSFITLASLYRPMYYNLVDNKFGRRVGFLLVPYLLGMLFLVSLEISSHIWYPENTVGTGILKSQYDDLRLEGQLIYRGSLPSKYVSNGYLELFIKYLPSPDDKTLAERCPGFSHSKVAGFDSDIVIVTDDDPPYYTSPDSALLCLSQLYKIEVADSIFENPTYYFHEHKNEEEKGVLAVLDVQYLPRGPHEVKVEKWRFEKIEKKDTLVMDDYFAIPFWVE